jgi:hypothetical protein
MVSVAAGDSHDMEATLRHSGHLLSVLVDFGCRFILARCHEEQTSLGLLKKVIGFFWENPGCHGHNSPPNGKNC